MNDADEAFEKHLGHYFGLFFLLCGVLIIVLDILSHPRGWPLGLCLVGMGGYLTYAYRNCLNWNTIPKFLIFLFVFIFIEGIRQYIFGNTNKYDLPGEPLKLGKGHMIIGFFGSAATYVIWKLIEEKLIANKTVQSTTES